MEMTTQDMLLEYIREMKAMYESRKTSLEFLIRHYTATTYNEYYNEFCSYEKDANRHQDRIRLLQDLLFLKGINLYDDEYAEV